MIRDASLLQAMPLSMFFPGYPWPLFFIHVQYTQTELIRLRHFTIRLNSHGINRTTRSQDPWNNDTWTFLILRTCQQTSVNSYEALYDSTRFARSPGSRKSTSGMMNRQQGKRFISIRSNQLELTTFSTHPAQSTGSQDLWNNDTWTFLVLKTSPQTSVNSCQFNRIKSNRQHF